MVTGLAPSSSGGELVFCSHRGLNSCRTRWPADVEQQLSSPRLRLLLWFCCFVPQLCAPSCGASQMWDFTSGLRPHLSRRGKERMLMLTATGRFTLRAEGLDSASLKWAALLLCFISSVKTEPDTDAAPLSLVLQKLWEFLHCFLKDKFHQFDGDPLT